MRHPDITIWTAPPPNPVSKCTVQATGGPGGFATYFYWIVSHYPIGSVVSKPFQIRGAPAPPTPQRSVIISWESTSASAYDILRTPTATLPPDGSNFALALGFTSTLFLDQGQNLQPYSLGGLPHAAPTDGWAHMNNRDYTEPVLELWPSVRIAKVIFADGSQQNSAGGGVAAGVASISPGNLMGPVTLAAGSGIAIGNIGQSITISASLNASQIPLSPTIGAWTTVQNALQAIAAGGGVASISPGNLTGAVILAAGANVAITQSGQTITISATGGGGGGSQWIDVPGGIAFTGNVGITGDLNVTGTLFINGVPFAAGA